MSMSTREDLRRTLARIDGRGYKAYQDIRGTYDLDGAQVEIAHVQGDPYAPPSRLHAQIDLRGAGLLPLAEGDTPRLRGLEDFIGRALAHAIGASGCRDLAIDHHGQEVLLRSTVRVREGGLEVRLALQLPAAGRRVRGHQAARILLNDLPEILAHGTSAHSLDLERAARHQDVREDHTALQGTLREENWIAFVANGAILPRRAGHDDRPLEKSAVPFRAPASLEREITLPHAGRVRGMAIPPGVTLLVGGGFHGKSTLLDAIARGIYPHIPGDGRECIGADRATVKVRAEDGRAVTGTDISAFIGELPYGRTTHCFSTTNASGSTSQAANIIEALEAGSRLLLVDEDTAATNFMIRDHRMQELVAKEKEPITPFVDKVRQLYEERGVSSIIVAGGSGDYFDVADRVIVMDSYIPSDRTEEAARIARKHRAERTPEGGDHFGGVADRIPDRASVDPSRGRREVNVQTRGLRTIRFGEETVDLSAVSQIVDASQVRALAAAILYARERYMDGRLSIREILDAVDDDLAAEGLAALSRRPVGDHAAFRRLELAAALNRLRSFRVIRK